jgi:hypothetical protein
VQPKGSPSSVTWHGSYGCAGWNIPPGRYVPSVKGDSLLQYDRPVGTRDHATRASAPFCGPRPVRVACNSFQAGGSFTLAHPVTQFTTAL